jgi:hypothetical protein
MLVLSSSQFDPKRTSLALAFIRLELGPEQFAVVGLRFLVPSVKANPYRRPHECPHEQTDESTSCDNCDPPPHLAHAPQSLRRGALAQLYATIREVVSHRIKNAAETTNTIVTAKPTSVAQMYLSQLITSFLSAVSVGGLFHIKPRVQCRLLALS